MNKILLTLLVLFSFNSRVVLSVELSQRENLDDSLVTPRKDVFDPSARIGKDGGALVFKAKSAMVPGECEYRRKVAGLVKVYKICAHTKVGSLKAWEHAFEVDQEKPSDFLLSLDFTYDVGGKRAANSFRAALKDAGVKTSGAEEFLKFVEGLPVEDGSKLELYFGKDLEEGQWFVASFISGEEKREFESGDKTFAHGLASIWLGEKAVDEKIKKALLR